MSNFIIAVGYTASGNVGCGVVDRLDESNCTRMIGSLVSQYLQEKDHGVNLLRIDKNNSYSCEDCYVRADKANEIAKSLNVELYVEIHINAGGGTGPEVCVAGKSEVANQYAVKVSNALAGAFINSLTFALSEITGRSYGGGVLTFEPGEVRKLLIPMNGAQEIEIDIIDKALRENRIEDALDINDEILLRKNLGLSIDEILMLRGIWKKLKDRRVNRKKKNKSSLI